MKLIDKDALVAEIEKIRAKWFGINNDFADGQKGALTDVLSLIDTLEVKEVNLGKPYDGIKVQTSYRGNSLDGVIVKTTYKAQKGE